MNVTYDYPHNGGYADTVAILSDGRKLYINTQYSEVLENHAAGCEKGQCDKSLSNVCAEGARRDQAICTCGATHGINDAKVIADARQNGKFGYRPVVKAPAQADADPIKRGAGWCDKCHSY